jgi:hypothetical protein
MQFCPALPQRAGAKHISFHEAAAKGDPALAPQTSPKTRLGTRGLLLFHLMYRWRELVAINSSMADVYCIVLYRFTVLYRFSSVVYPSSFDTPASICSVNDPK